MSTTNTAGVSRRNLLGATAGVAAAGAALTLGQKTYAQAAVADADDYDWDYECDILFVGAGASMMGAIDAHNAGAKVMLIEKRDVLGGDTWLCGGVIRAGGNTRAQQEAGIIDERTGEPDTLEQMYRGLVRGGGGRPGRPRGGAQVRRVVAGLHRLVYGPRRDLQDLHRRRVPGGPLPPVRHGGRAVRRHRQALHRRHARGARQAGRGVPYQHPRHPRASGPRPQGHRRSGRRHEHRRGQVLQGQGRGPLHRRQRLERRAQRPLQPRDHQLPLEHGRPGHLWRSTRVPSAPATATSWPWSAAPR